MQAKCCNITTLTNTHDTLIPMIQRFGGKLGQHSDWMLVWISSMLNPKQPMSGADLESFSDHNEGTKRMERAAAATWRSMARITSSRWGSLALACCLPRRGYSDNKPTGKGGSSALVVNLPRRRKLKTYGPRTLLSLSHLARPWQLNLVFFSA